MSISKEALLEQLQEAARFAAEEAYAKRDGMHTAADAWHDQARVIIIDLCRALKNRELDMTTVEELICGEKLPVDILSILCQVLTDDMRISKNFRRNPVDQLAVYGAVLTGMKEYFFHNGFQLFAGAYEKLLIVSPPQNGIRVALVDFGQAFICSAKEKFFTKLNEACARMP